MVFRSVGLSSLAFFYVIRDRFLSTAPARSHETEVAVYPALFSVPRVTFSHQFFSPHFFDFVLYLVVSLFPISVVLDSDFLSV